MERDPAKRDSMRHPLFYGEHDLDIDEKNRISIPVEIRKSIDPERDGSAFFIIIGVNRRPWFYPERYYEDLVNQPTPEITPGEELLDFDHINFAMAHKKEWDSQGRLVLPEKTLKRTNTNREVVLAGIRDHLELWNRPDWEAHREALFA